MISTHLHLSRFNFRLLLKFYQAHDQEISSVISDIINTAVWFFPLLFTQLFSVVVVKLNFSLSLWSAFGVRFAVRHCVIS